MLKTGCWSRNPRCPRTLSNCPSKEEVTEIAFKRFRNYNNTPSLVLIKTIVFLLLFGPSHPRGNILVGLALGILVAGGFSMMGKKRVDMGTVRTQVSHVPPSCNCGSTMELREDIVSVLCVINTPSGLQH